MMSDDLRAGSFAAGVPAAPSAPAARRIEGRTGWLAEIWRLAVWAGFYGLLSGGLFYFTYKFYQPDAGGTDYYHYYQMYLHPLDLRMSDAPFAYRQVSAVLTHLVYKYGPYYHPTVFFSKPGYDQHVFFAALLTNFAALLGCATLAAVTTRRLSPNLPGSAPLLAGAFCYLETIAQSSGMGPITDGVAWLVMALAFLGYVSGSLITVALMLAISVVERETIPIMLGAIAGVRLILSRGHRRFDLAVVALSLGAFAVYFALRTVWAPVAGHESQTHVKSLMKGLGHWRGYVTHGPLLEGLLSQNLLILLGLTMAWRRLRRAPPLPGGAGQLVVALFGAVAAVTLVCIAVGNDLGRIVAMLTPVAAPLLALAMFAEEASPARSGRDRVSAAPDAGSSTDGPSRALAARAGAE